MNNIWGQLVRDTTLASMTDLPVSARRTLGSEVKEGCARRRPRGFRAENVKPIQPRHPEGVVVSRTATPANPWKLTSHQYTAIAMMSQGATRSNVAEEMNICRKTLSIHLTRVREKMGVHRVEEAVTEWLRVNLQRDVEQRRVHANEVLIFNLRRVGIKLP